MTSGDSPSSHAPLDRLLVIMEKLRDIKTGCPWDREQTFQTIAPYTIEEAYEVAEAVAEGNMISLQEELGDLLFQVVFYAQMASEIDAFTFADIANTISDKMIRRHPHVFGESNVDTAEAQTNEWERQKTEEREQKAKTNGVFSSVMDDVPIALPALSRAVKLQKRASRVGFDWPDVKGVLEKMTEEIEELRDEVLAENSAKMAEELGDVLFAWTNYARFQNIDPEAALRNASSKFERRFRRIEAILAKKNRSIEKADLEELERLWDQAKSEEPSRL